MRRLSASNTPWGNLFFLRPRDAFIDMRIRINEHLSHQWWAQKELLETFDSAIDAIERDAYTMMLAWVEIFEHKMTSQYDAILYNIMTSDSAPIRTIRKILIQAGIAYPLWYGDWDVDRSTETYWKMTGTRSPNDLIQEIEWYYIEKNIWVPKNGFISMNLGAGNGQSMHEQRKHYIDRKEYSDVPKWHFIGMADKIYFPLSRLIQNFWKGDEKIGEEISRFFMTQTQYAVQSFRTEHPDSFHQLQKDLRGLRDFIIENRSLFTIAIEDGAYRADDEFADRSKQIWLSPEAQIYIREFSSQPEVFFATYFDADFHGDAISERAPIYMQNIFIWDFSQIDKKFAWDDIFHFVSSIRGTSHVDNLAYEQLMISAWKKLAPGGYFVDDGIRRSYTREIRIWEVQSALCQSEKNLRAYIVKDSGWKILSVIFEKGIWPDANGEYIFRSADRYKEFILLEWYTISLLHSNFSSKWRADIIGDQKVRIRDLVLRQILKETRKDKNNMGSYYRMLPYLDGVQKAIDITLSEIWQQNFYDIKAIAEKALKEISKH